MTTDPPGLDLVALGRWLEDAAPDVLSGPLEGQVIAGGRSNLTYRVSDGSRTVVVRRPPLGHVLATAHDMGREYRVISALADTAVPVPVAYALCEDVSVTGAPFYVMAHVDGTPYRLASELAALGAERTQTIGQRMVDTLADLHLVDPQSVGLGEFGRPSGFLARQVRRWGQQLDASHTRDLAGVDELRHRLAERVPQEGAPAIVHGDYRLDNLLVLADDTIGAVVDWEMATLGDPLTDVALLLTYHRMARLDTSGVVSSAARARGFVTRDEVVDRYAARTGRAVSHLGFYEALACFKLAVVLEGIHYRHVHGQTVGEGFGAIGDQVAPLVAMGLDSIKEND